MGGTRQPFILHYAGSTWSEVPGPSNLSGVILRGVSALGPSSAWAVGTSTLGALALHWDGTKWSTQDVSFLASSAFFNGVDALSGPDVLAVGADGFNAVMIQKC